jgi:hypothetical protein
MSKHIYAPWSACRTISGQYKLGAGHVIGFAVCDARGTLVCQSPTLHDANQELRANAALIAAAPELLHALQALLKSLSDSDEEGLMEEEEQVIAARIAIGKALLS